MATVPSHELNHWPEGACARAFWGQQEISPYRRLLKHTTAWLAPAPGDRWLDLGCGCGQLTQALWQKSEGRVEQIISLDCAAENAGAIEELRKKLLGGADADRIRFVCSDFSGGLSAWEDGSFDGVVSGLAIQYAEHYSQARRAWTDEAYNGLLADIYRVLRPGGAFVFSVNVPEPAWGKVALRSLKAVFQTPKPGRFLLQSWQMMRYGDWLKRQARLGRFHYFSSPTVKQKLISAGYVGIEHRLTYADQAYLFRCIKPA